MIIRLTSQILMNDNTFNNFNLSIIHKEDIVEAIDRLDDNKGPGPDSIAPIFLEKLQQEPCGTSLANL
ncbi:hypothetical protein JTB14_014753 [Gonioctena quinquepunctata]|nr:hypothetical protein JTB14_014753 [Gonioctena quinquepunctata]